MFFSGNLSLAGGFPDQSFETALLWRIRQPPLHLQVHVPKNSPDLQQSRKSLTEFHTQTHFSINEIYNQLVVLFSYCFFKIQI